MKNAHINYTTDFANFFVPVIVLFVYTPARLSCSVVYNLFFVRDINVFNRYNIIPLAVRLRKKIIWKLKHNLPINEFVFRAYRTVMKFQESRESEKYSFHRF